MDQEQIYRYIAQMGYRTLTELKEEFKEADPEVLSMTLNFLIEKRGVQKTSFQGPVESNTIYSIRIM